MVRANFAHLGATGAEFLGLSEVSPEELLGRYRIDGLEHVEAARSQRRGVLFLTAHLGNWELASTVMAARGYPLSAVARRLKNPWVDRRVRGLRERFGTDLISHRNAVRPVLRTLRRGGMVALLMDQKPLAKEAVLSHFFGQTVATNQGLALLALKSEAPVIPGFDERVGDAHVLHLEAPLEPPGEGPREERVRRFTEQFDAKIEQAVRRRPEQWFWVHRRWRLPGGMEP
jgi:KDO2-lipid IV(A) lauroyltransferase